MDRPSNGHRRHDAESGTGSVTVVDLIRRQQAPVRIPSADEAATIQFMTDLLGAEPEPASPPAGDRGWLGKGAKLAGLAVGSIVLCGSVYAASTLSHRTPSSGDAALPDTVLTGAGALRPDEVAAQLAGATPYRPTPAQRTAAPAVGAGIATGRATGTVIGHAPVTTTTNPGRSGGPVTAAPRSAAQVVRTFYQLVASDPELATEWLSPGLLAGDGIGFDQAWAALRRVQVESVRQTSSQNVQVVVRMQEPDGTWLRVVERLHVTSGAQPRINGAELLSAQRG